MSVVWLEGFDVCRHRDSIIRRYAAESASASSGWSWVTGRLQGFALNSGTTSGTLVVPVTSHDEYIAGFAINWVTGSSTTLPAGASASRIFKFRIGATEQCRLVHTRDATDSTKFRLSFVVGTTVMATSQALFGGQWYYIELKVKMNTVGNTNGSYELRINQATEFSGASVTTAASGSSNQIDTISIDLDCDGTGSVTYDDMVLLNTLGSVNNAFLGDQVVEEAQPTSDGPVINFSIFPTTPTTHFDKVDDPATAVPDDDSTYTYSTSAGQKDFYGFGPLTFLQGNLTAVQVSAAMRLTSAGSRNFHFRYRNSGGTEGAGTTQALTQTSYGPERTQVFDRSPIDSSVLTVTQVNSGFLGVQVD